MCELLCGLVTRRCTVKDGSAAVTGLLLALTLPATASLWQCALGAFFAIGIVKALFSGLGQNLFNPALAGRALMMLVWPVGITRFAALGVDGVIVAPLLHHMRMPALPEESILDLFLGNCPGCIGEISALALLVGGAYLAWRRVISVRIPLAYLGTVAVLMLVFPKVGTPEEWMLGNLFSGGAMLGAIFMATDYVTSSVTSRGQLIYGIGCGALTVLFRYFGLFQGGVTYAILLMNAAAWIIDRYAIPLRAVSARRKEAAHEE